ncbi:histidine-rich glycoprotein-like [Coccinella septempunctata]|uniref:histidine-rich glycoprotein-like n=1 Tax=Coccinella septempunctata TaxID=41139 RepID=UPI001D079068|nr:histidine-rich glycoprotein-like [Coccinella septempunctata]
MELWIIIATLTFLQNTAQPIRVDHHTKSKFLIVANTQDPIKDDTTPKNDPDDFKHHTFSSNRSHPRIKNDKKHTISIPTLQSINLLSVGKNEGQAKNKGGKLPSSTFEITPADSTYLGYTIDNHLLENPPLSNPPNKIHLKKDQHVSKKHTNVKLPNFQQQTLYNPSTDFEPSNVESTINRPKIYEHLEPEKPVHEHFPSDLKDLIEKAQRMDFKGKSGSPRKHRNSDDNNLGYKSENYEIQEYPDHQPYLDHNNEYHVYHDAPLKKKKKEIHYHQHKHLHEHDHDQKHEHKHQSGHHHDHGHDHHQKHKHSHGHDDDHWHDHHELGEHHHQSHHGHDHHSSHEHKHHQDHDHKHDSGHHHDHEDHHDHHEDHKNWHGHKHHSDHDHRHGHDHRHKSKHGHDHKHSHKHKHSHHQKHGGKY